MPTSIGRNGVRSTTPLESPRETSAAAPTAPVAPPPQGTGWSAGASQRRAVDPGVTPPPASAADLQATRPNPVQQALQRSVDTLNGRIEAALHHDAGSIAHGLKPTREGDALTEAQTKELQAAATDFVKDLPLGALAPEVAATVQARLKEAGLEVRDVASTRLGDIGSIGGDIAKDLIKDLRRDSPTAYYSLAATAAAAIGYTAWNDGSAKLARLGVKPEVKGRYFDDKLQVKLRGDWQAHFRDFKATATVGTHLKLGNAGDLTAAVSANTRTGFEGAQVGYTLDRVNMNLSANADFDSAGLKRLALTTAYHSDTLAASAAVTANSKGVETAGGRVTWTPSQDFSLSTGVDRNFQTSRTTGTAEARWKVRPDVDLALSASHDSAGESRVGAGLTFRF